MHVQPGRDKEAGPKVPKQHTWEFKLVEEESKLQEVLKGPIGLVLVHHDDRINRVAVIEGILDEAFPVLYPNPHL